MRQLIRTNERCYICDFSSPISIGKNEREYEVGETIVGVFQDGLCSVFQDERGRFVFVDPGDNRPVCTQCAKVSRDAVRELEYRDRDGEPKTWKESKQDLFKKWEHLLNEDIKKSKQSSLAQDAESGGQMEQETT